MLSTMKSNKLTQGNIQIIRNQEREFCVMGFKLQKKFVGRKLLNRLYC
jgi:hypothetical protein